MLQSATSPKSPKRKSIAGEKKICLRRGSLSPWELFEVFLWILGELFSARFSAKFDFLPLMGEHVGLPVGAEDLVAHETFLEG